jgi:hypothetical protein
MRQILTFLALAFQMLHVHAQESLTTGFIDFYGLRTVTEEVRALLPFEEGDPATPHDPNFELELAEALGVSRVKIGGSCCSEPGVVTAYIGIEETPELGLEYHSMPAGDVLLPREILATAGEIDAVMVAAMQSREAVSRQEDWSEGHALAMNFPELRALQERYIVYAEQYRGQLIEVLRNSADAGQRAIAANVMGYASDKQAIIPELERAVLDPYDGVRNNATRALGVIAQYVNIHPELSIEIPPNLYIDMLNSIYFGDRNKGSMILLSLTSSRDPDLLTQLRERSLLPLIEMCRWKSQGHYYAPCKILERVVGLPERDGLHPAETTIAVALELLE